MSTKPSTTAARRLRASRAAPGECCWHRTPPVRRNDHHHGTAYSLLPDPALNVFHNSEAFLFCNYALCHPSRGGQTTPSLDRCRSNCANIARTDEHASQIEDAAAELRAQSCSPLLPEPLADRLRHKADHPAQRATDHRAFRITVDQENS
jgi:hypothetical protein